MFNRLFAKLSSIFRPDSSYKAFFLSMLAFGLAYGLYKGILDNYLAEIVTMSEFDKGVSEFFRELPGVTMVFLLALLYTMSAEKIYKLGAIIMVAGIAMQSVCPATRTMVIIAMFIYSLGEHLQLGMKSTISMEYAHEGKGGEALGWQNAIFQAGTLAGFLIIIAVFYLLDSTSELFRTMFGVSAIITGAGLMLAWKMVGTSQADSHKRRFYFRKKYTKYYMLEVFYGARKQIFLTFGPYVLVLFYGANTMAISTLFAITSVFSFLLAPSVGKLIDRLGYKVIMVADTLLLVVVCFFYGFAHHLFPMDVAFIVCCVNFVLDSVISMASMASNVYVQDLSDNSDEVKATISTGLSVNHLITIIIALCGGWVWKVLGIETLFMISAALGLCNSAYAATIKPRDKAEHSPAL